MFALLHGRGTAAARGFCDRLPRRDFLAVGALGLGGLSLAGLLRAQRAAAATPSAAAGTPGRARSVILVCLNGGPSQLDMVDMKPDAPEEIRGEFRPIASRVPGFDVCELLPQLAAQAQRWSVVRSVRMQQPNHQLHECYTGYGEGKNRPALGAVVSRLQGPGPGGLPAYVSLSLSDHPRTVLLAEKPHYAGLAHAPFEPSDELLESLRSEGAGPERLRDRTGLLAAFDRWRAETDPRGGLAAVDAFQAQALEILTGARVRQALDLSREPESVRRRYGEDVASPWNYQFGHTWHSSDFLLARRLVEAGARVVTLAPGAWDHHGNLNGVRGTIFERLRERLPLLDNSLAALVGDLAERGLLDETLVVVWGEFGRTPRVNAYGGRDHWTPVNFVLLAGGGLRPGLVVGQTDRQAGEIVSRVYGPQHVLATAYHALGIDPRTTLTSLDGRPLPLLDDPTPIAELV